MTTPKISVCIPMFNASRYLRECIDSILAQTFTDFELLIADDGSTDNSVEIVESYTDPRIRLI
ncbi:MAG: glycosyltransferase, partial [Bacteroides sp.]|nr:glycosyltransferase [Bacteroides sp.]